MKEKEKADEMYINAIRLHGIEKAKKESLNSAIAIHALAPIENNGLKNKNYWDTVIEHLKNK